jgi:hypothetical protein
MQDVLRDAFLIIGISLVTAPLVVGAVGVFILVRTGGSCGGASRAL